MDEYYNDPRYSSSQGRWVTYNSDQGPVWEPLTVGAPTGQYVTINGDAGGQWIDYTALEMAAIAAQKEAARKAELQKASEYLANNPLAISGNQIATQYGNKDISYFNPIVNPEEQITGSTLTQLKDPSTGALIYLSNPNDPLSFTYENTGIPAAGGTLEQQAALYRPFVQNGVFGTLGGDLLDAVKDPYFRNFAIAAAAMAAAAALAPAAGGSVGGSTAGGAGATAYPIDFGSTIITGGEMASGAGGLAATDFGSFIAADAAASAAGQGAFDLAAALGMPLDEAVTAGLINGAGNLTVAGADALMNVAGVAGNAATTGTTASTLTGLGTTGAESTIATTAATTGATTGAGGLLNAGKEILSGTTGDIVKGALVAGGLAAADALKPDQEAAKGGGLTAAELKALVDAMPSMIGQYAAQAQSGTGLNGAGYNQGTNQALAALFPTFIMPTQSQSFGAGRFGSNYNPAPFTSLV